MASFATNAATGDKSSATANWQGVIPGVAVPEGGFIVTGKDGTRDIPTGQLMRKPDGTLTGSLIDLEGHLYTAATEAGPSGTPAAKPEEVGALQKATWAVEEAKFYVNGVEVQGTSWNIYDRQELLASIDNAGVVKAGTAAAITTATDKIELKVESDAASNAAINQYAGSEAALSVTIMATSA